ncbi:hypothetical protein IPA_09600 [Ignicoccus pacificus DSM 13166]|uniref:Methyltransferase domain-containing protein n=1 Tax=Ignicoccus pacificus DSM 13166 TaxID=940294 RepID=A0A977KCR6_9CREN|nr:hypothetical protein IPA_09600 [Ignicoccus pacificus DSM 13166]
MPARPKIITKVLESIYPLHDDVVAIKFIERGYYKRALELLGNWKRILEVGCGTGRLLEVARENGKPLWGLDISLKFLKISKERFKDYPADFVYGTATNLPFRSNSFDGVLTFTMIHHLTKEEKIQMIEEIAKLSDKYAFGEVGKRICWSAILLKIIGSKDLISKELFKKAGMKIERWEDPKGFCLIIGLARRLSGPVRRDAR